MFDIPCQAFCQAISPGLFCVLFPHFYQPLFFRTELFLKQNKIPATLTFPEYYVSRPELEQKVIDAIFHRRVRSNLLSNNGLVISGIGGIGKSILIGAVLHRSVSEFHLQNSYPSGVFHLELENEKIDQAVFNLAITLDIIDHLQDDTPKTKAFITRRMKKIQGVFVLDGIQSADEIEEFIKYIDTSTSFVIATTRISLPETTLSRIVVDSIEMPQHFSIEESRSVVKNITKIPIKNSDLEIFRKIHQRVEGLPLAIVILAGLSSTTHLSWMTIEKALLESTMKSLEVGGKSSKHESVRAAFDLSYRFLKRKSQSAAHLFMKIGLFSRPMGSLIALQRISNLNDAQFLGEVDTLVHANLIRVEFGTNDSEKWFTHSLLKDYASELLNKDNRRSIAEKKYVEYFKEVTLEFEDQFNQGVNDSIKFSGAISDICHAADIAMKHGWSWEAVSLIRASISPMITMGQFQTLGDLEKIAENHSQLPAKEKVVLENGLAKIKLWRHENSGAIKLLENVINAGFPTESVNAARTLAQIYLDKGDINSAHKYLALAYSILKKIPPDYAYPLQELWGQYYEELGNYYLHTSQPKVAFNAFEDAQKYLQEYPGWMTHIKQKKARCLLELGDFNETLGLLASLPTENNEYFNLDAVDRNLIEAECYRQTGDIIKAEMKIKSLESLLGNSSEQPGLESHIAKYRDLLNWINQRSGG
jgi:hypothetical protein